MPGPDAVLLGYGPAPGMELIPYFLAMLAWAGLAVLSILLSPVSAVFRRLRRGRPAAAVEPAGPPVAPPAAEAPGESPDAKA